MDKIKAFCKKNSNSAQALLLLACLLSGGFNEYISCALSALISAVLTVRLIRSRALTLNVNIVSISITAILLGYLITTFYALDSGMAFIGFLKFLPAALFMLLLMQDKNMKEAALNALPYLALALGALSAIFMLIPAFNGYFTVAGRLGGFFQYPNSFALFLLTGELVALSKEKIRLADAVVAAALVALMLLTGSRAVFVLAVAANILILFFKKGKKHKIVIVAVCAAAAAAIFILLPVLRDNPLFSRYLSLSLDDSTFVGRLLYWCDALPVLLKNPFGLGYMGYYYIQQSIQTGVYSVMYIHNDLLQIMLDVGWVPFALFVAGIIRSIFSTRATAAKRIIIITFVLHCMFDFDLQFTAMFFVLLLLLDFDTGKELRLLKGRTAAAAALIISGAVSLYFAIALCLSYFGLCEPAQAMCPFNTQNNISVLIGEEDIDAQSKDADKIISQNKYVQIAYSAKARQAYSQGDFEKLMEYKNKIFDIAPFAYDEYEEYCYMLIQGIYLYNQAGDSGSADYCAEELIKTSDRLSGLKSRLSELGRRIYDQPKTELPDDVREYIEQIKSGKAV